MYCEKNGSKILKQRKATKKDTWKVSISFRKKRKQQYGSERFKILVKNEKQDWLNIEKIILKSGKTLPNIWDI